MNEVALVARNISVSFTSGRGGNRNIVTALKNVSLEVGRGEVVGLVGESGSGKSTLARVLIGLQPVSSGEISLDGMKLQRNRSLEQRRKIQMVFQDPYSSLDPRMTVEQIISEILRVHQIVPKHDLRNRCQALMNSVRLPANLLNSRPDKMSGGQRQRVAIARALALEPEFLIADEAVSALDVSVQASIINLLGDLREQLGLSILFISHDLAVVRQLCDTVNVIHMGEIVEKAPKLQLFGQPQHEYTRELIAAVPQLHSSLNRNREP